MKSMKRVLQSAGQMAHISQLTISPQEASEICISCGECCKYVGIFTPHYSDEDDIIEFYHARGLKILENEDRSLSVVLESRCPHLTEQGCAIYDKRPEICRQPLYCTQLPTCKVRPFIKD